MNNYVLLIKKRLVADKLSLSNYNLLSQVFTIKIYNEVRIYINNFLTRY